MTLMKNVGDSIQIPCDAVVFGKEQTIFLLHENILALLQFNMIGQAVISAYMMLVLMYYFSFLFQFCMFQFCMFIFYLCRHLYTEIREAKELDTFGFFHPGLTFNLNEEFQSYVVERLREGNDRIYFMSYNTK